MFPTWGTQVDSFASQGFNGGVAKHLSHDRHRQTRRSGAMTTVLTDELIDRPTSICVPNGGTPLKKTLRCSSAHFIPPAVHWEASRRSVLGKRRRRFGRRGQAGGVGGRVRDESTRDRLPAGQRGGGRTRRTGASRILFAGHRIRALRPSDLQPPPCAIRRRRRRGTDTRRSVSHRRSCSASPRAVAGPNASARPPAGTVRSPQ
jgi:hypothetical protein